MAYESRSLTDQERAELIRVRRARGFPLHAPPHPFRDGGAYLITAANYLHQPFLVLPERRSDLEARLCEALARAGIDLHAWVMLPNHYHFLIELPRLELLAPVLKRLHGGTSLEWNRAEKRPGRRVWYRYHDRKIRNEAHFMQALNYIHANPAKHGYVKQAGKWPWSSLAAYREVEGLGWLADQWRQFRPADDFGSGWDDEPAA